MQLTFHATGMPIVVKHDAEMWTDGVTMDYSSKDDRTYVYCGEMIYKKIKVALQRKGWAHAWQIIQDALEAQEKLDDLATDKWNEAITDLLNFDE